jgi:hypothetical protein
VLVPMSFTRVFDSARFDRDHWGPDLDAKLLIAKGASASTPNVTPATLDFCQRKQWCPDLCGWESVKLMQAEVPPLAKLCIMCA